MFWIDTHFHAGDYLPDFSLYVREAAAEGVGALLLCASGAAECASARRIAETFGPVSFAAGLHPHNAAEERSFPRELPAFESSPKLVAAGEIGLDYFYDFCPPEIQREVFAEQLDWALSAGLPAIIHCRDKADSLQAYDDTFSLLEPFAGKGGCFVLHCYAGTPGFAERFLALGGFFGVGGMITFNKADNIRELAGLLPLDRLLLETDSPYLAPKPYRGKPNHSRYIPLIGAKLAEVKGISLEECARVTCANALRLFPRLAVPPEVRP